MCPTLAEKPMCSDHGRDTTDPLDLIENAFTSRVKEIQGDGTVELPLQNRHQQILSALRKMASLSDDEFNALAVGFGEGS